MTVDHLLTKDWMARELEIREILTQIRDGQRVLDSEPIKCVQPSERENLNYQVFSS